MRQCFYHTVLSGPKKSLNLALQGEKETSEMLVISLPCLCVCHAWWTMGCSNDVVCGGLLVRWNQPTEPRSAQCEFEENESTFWRLFVAPVFLSQACVGRFVLRHTQRPNMPLQCLHTAVSVMPEQQNSLRKATESGPSSSLGTSWALHVPPPTWPKTGSRLKPAWMYTPLGSSEVGLLGSNFQPPCGSLRFTACRPGVGTMIPSDWRCLSHSSWGLITAKLWVSSGGASTWSFAPWEGGCGFSLACGSTKLCGWKGSFSPTYQRQPCGSSERNTGSQVQHGQPGGRGQWTPRQKSELSSCSHPSVLMTNVTAYWPSFEPKGQQEQLGELDHSVLVTTPTLLVDKHWCLKTYLYNMNQPCGLFLGLQCWCVRASGTRSRR